MLKKAILALVGIGSLSGGCQPPESAVGKSPRTNEPLVSGEGSAPAPQKTTNGLGTQTVAPVIDSDWRIQLSAACGGTVDGDLIRCKLCPDGTSNGKVEWNNPHSQSIRVAPIWEGRFGVDGALSRVVVFEGCGFAMNDPGLRGLFLPSSERKQWRAFRLSQHCQKLEMGTGEALLCQTSGVYGLMEDVTVLLIVPASGQELALVRATGNDREACDGAWDGKPVKSDGKYVKVDGIDLEIKGKPSTLIATIRYRATRLKNAVVSRECERLLEHADEEPFLQRFGAQQSVTVRFTCSGLTCTPETSSLPKGEGWQWLEIAQ